MTPVPEGTSRLQRGTAHSLTCCSQAMGNRSRGRICCSESIDTDHILCYALHVRTDGARGGFPADVRFHPVRTNCFKILLFLAAYDAEDS